MNDQRGSAKNHRAPRTRRPTNIDGVFDFTPPPENFDANTATRRELFRHGVLLRRPDPIGEPRLFATWTRIIGRLWRPETFSPVHLEPQFGIRHVLYPPERQVQGPDTSQIWSGCAIAGKWAGAFTNWWVPEVTAPADAAGQAIECASWVGLDGSFLPGTTSSDVLQAGVSHNVDSAGVASHTAWYEWFVPDAESVESQFPYVWQTNIDIDVKAGDEVAVAIQYVTSDTAEVGNPAPPTGPYSYGAIQFVNVTDNKGKAFYMPPPPGAGDFAGDSAEWIMERGSPFLPKFGAITFDTAGSCSPGGNMVGQPINGTLVTMVDGGGRPQTAESATPNSLTITDIFN